MSNAQWWAAVLVFAGTYAVIAFARIPRLHLDRPGAALCGAVLMILCGVLSFDSAWQAIDSRTIVLLLGMMLLNVLLEESGFFDLAAARVLNHTRSGRQLLVGLAVLAALLSALILNDTVCLMLTPPVLAIVARARLAATPYLVTLAMSTNVGSVMTLVGNPQNMLIGNYSGWSYAQFCLWMLPVAAAAMAATIVILLWFYGAKLAGGAWPPPPRGTEVSEPVRIDRPLLVQSLLVLAGVIVAFAAGCDLPLTAMAGAAVLMLVSRRSPAMLLARVNWVLLVFFAGLFIVVAGIERTGLVAQAADQVQPYYGNSLATQIPVFSGLTVLASNIVSNVPFVVLSGGIVPHLIEPDLMWLVLSMASTFGGNLSIPGSVATLIVLEVARQQPPDRRATIGFFEFLRVGIPVTLATTTLGAVILAVEYWLVRR